MRRRLSRLCLFLSLGAIINVVVAWRCVYWSIAEAHVICDSDEYARLIPWARSIGALPSIFEDETIRVFLASGPGMRNWFVYPITLFDSQGVVVTQSGWPLLCVQGHYFQPTDSNGYNVGGWKAVNGIFVPFRPPGRYGRVLPWRPLAAPFAANSFFYAMILWFCFSVPFKLRRHARLRRNLCPKCAYPIGANAICTECGQLIARP